MVLKNAMTVALVLQMDALPFVSTRTASVAPLLIILQLVYTALSGTTAQVVAKQCVHLARGQQRRRQHPPNARLLSAGTDTTAQLVSKQLVIREHG